MILVLVLWSLLTADVEVKGFPSEVACVHAAPRQGWFKCIPTDKVEHPDPYDAFPDNLYEPY